MQTRRAAGPGPGRSSSGGPMGPPGRRERPNFAALGRAIRYLGRYRSLSPRAYLFLFLATGAQLLVPQVVQNVIDGVRVRPRDGGRWTDDERTASRSP